ncbi:MAG: flagellar filament capping protein FliD [Planctomycetota bacterium]
MGRIQTSIGLITGTDIVGTVDQLISISARPRDLLLGRTQQLQAEQQEITALTASVIGVQLAGDALASEAIFNAKSATSSDESSLSVSTSETAKKGTYTVQTLQTAATHSVLSAQSFSATDTALGLEGTLTFQPDGFVDSSTSLRELNGGLGIQAGTIRITDRSGASADIDLSTARTVEDVLTAINDAPIGVRATTQGDSFRLIDQTGSTTSNLRVEQLGDAETAADLGLWGVDVAASEVVGDAIELPDGVSALNGAALSQLGGGAGLGALTDLDIGLRDGSSGTVDLSSATTLTEVIDAINASGLEVFARVSDAGNGIRLRDVSGGSGSFTASSTDATASGLGIDQSVDGNILVGDNLNLATVTVDTTLAELNQGRGINSGSFTITDSDGAVAAVNTTVDEIDTVGDLIDRINDLGIGVTAAINEDGDGVVVTDTAGGSGSLTIADTGTGTTAAELGLAGTAAASTLAGTQATSITVEAGDTLQGIVDKINASARYADASIVANGDGTFQLELRANRGGESGRFGVNTDGLDLNLRTSAQGQDAVISVAEDGGVQRFLTSTDGVFSDATSGLDFTALAVSDGPVTVTVDDNPDALVSRVNTFADQFNRLVDKLDELTFFNADANEVGLLFGSSEALRIESGYSRLLSGRLQGESTFGSLGQLGIRLDENGKLQVDETKLKDALASNSDQVKLAFRGSDPDTVGNDGLVGQLSRLADRFAGDSNSMLLNKSTTLSTQIERNNDRVTQLNTRLDAERERLLRQYFAMEEAIADITSNQSVISQIQPISV